MPAIIPDFQTIMLPMLKILRDGKPHSLSEVLVQLATKFNLSDDDLRVKVPSGQQPLFKNRVTWATSYLKNSGLIHYPQRGVYCITKDGSAVLKQEPENITVAFLKKLEAYQNWQAGFSEGSVINTASTSEPDEKTPEEILGDTIKSVNEKVALELLELLKTKPPSYFEGFVLRLLNKMGYGGADENFEVVGKSGDNGIDGIIYQDQFGIDRVYVQAKRWAGNNVQSKDIRDFIGSLSIKGTNKGIFITTSDFTENSLETVRMNPQNRIILINGKQLAEYALKHNVGIQIKAEYHLKTLDNDFFEDL